MKFIYPVKKTEKERYLDNKLSNLMKTEFESMIKRHRSMKQRGSRTTISKRNYKNLNTIYNKLQTFHNSNYHKMTYDISNYPLSLILDTNSDLHKFVNDSIEFIITNEDLKHFKRLELEIDSLIQSIKELMMKEKNNTKDHNRLSTYLEDAKADKMKLSVIVSSFLMKATFIEERKPKRFGILSKLFKH